MKKSLLALVALASLSFVAASSNHQAFGPINFGMKGAVVSNADRKLLKEMKAANETFTAATARKLFVIPGRRYPAKLEAKDLTVPILMEVKPDHTGDPRPLYELTVSGPMIVGNAYADLQTSFEVFQDIGDSKLPRVSKRGEIPPIESFGIDHKDIVTDTWEGEGIRIELLVRSMVDVTTADTVYRAVLRATEIPLMGAR